MDELERRRFLNTLRSDDEFRATVRRELLTQELLDLPHTVAALVDAVAGQRQDFTQLAIDVRGYMERTITLIGDGFRAVDAKFAEQRADFDSKFAEQRADMDRGFATVDAKFAEQRGDMDRGFAAVDAKFDRVQAELAVIKDQLAS